MSEKVELLGEGYIQLIESWGSDEGIIEAARMSTGKGFVGWGPFPCDACGGLGHVQLSPESDARGTCRKCDGAKIVPGDEKLLRFLWENKHATPFEMAGMIIEVKAPIMVFREWHRHRTQSYNEMSARYIPLPDENYVPSVERLLMSSKINKQAGTIAGAEELTAEGAENFRKALMMIYVQQQAVYEQALRMGVPKELARLPVSVARFSRMRASANLRNWLAFLTLRKAPGAQWEIRQYADALGRMVAQAFPRTWEVFVCGGPL